MTCILCCTSKDVIYTRCFWCLSLSLHAAGREAGVRVLVPRSVVSRHADPDIFAISTIMGGEEHLQVSLSCPLAAVLSASGDEIFVIEGTGNCSAGSVLYRVSLLNGFPSSANGTASIIAGTGVYDNSGDGGASTAAALSLCKGIALTSGGDIVISDTGEDL